MGLSSFTPFVEVEVGSFYHYNIYPPDVKMYELNTLPTKITGLVKALYLDPYTIYFAHKLLLSLTDNLIPTLIGGVVQKILMDEKLVMDKNQLERITNKEKIWEIIYPILIRVGQSGWGRPAHHSQHGGQEQKLEYKLFLTNLIQHILLIYGFAISKEKIYEYVVKLDPPAQPESKTGYTPPVWIKIPVKKFLKQLFSFEDRLGKSNRKIGVMNPIFVNLVGDVNNIRLLIRGADDQFKPLIEIVDPVLNKVLNTYSNLLDIFLDVELKDDRDKIQYLNKYKKKIGELITELENVAGQVIDFHPNQDLNPKDVNTTSQTNTLLGVNLPMGGELKGQVVRIIYQLRSKLEQIEKWLDLLPTQNMKLKDGENFYERIRELVDGFEKSAFIFRTKLIGGFVLLGENNKRLRVLSKVVLHNYLESLIESLINKLTTGLKECLDYKTILQLVKELILVGVDSPDGLKVVYDYVKSKLINNLLIDLKYGLLEDQKNNQLFRFYITVSSDMGTGDTSATYNGISIDIGKKLISDARKVTYRFDKSIPILELIF